MNQKINDPPGLNKGDPNKAWCYKTIEIAVLDKVEEFLKKPKKSCDIENTNFNQLDFPINHLMFAFGHFKVSQIYKDQEEFKRLKIHFHAVLGKNEDEVWSLVKIEKVLSFVHDVLFKGIF